MANMNIREQIVNAMHETAVAMGSRITNELSDSVVLLESGLDSLGFAILVSRLEEDLGYDPFVLMEEPYYPRTLGEFVVIYERYQPQS
jgi:acyl carrier protein